MNIYWFFQFYIKKKKTTENQYWFVVLWHTRHDVLRSIDTRKLKKKVNIWLEHRFSFSVVCCCRFQWLIYKVCTYLCHLVSRNNRNWKVNPYDVFFYTILNFCCYLYHLWFLFSFFNIYLHVLSRNVKFIHMNSPNVLLALAKLFSKSDRYCIFGIF